MIRPQEVGVGLSRVGIVLHNPDITLPRDPVDREACLYLRVFLLKHRTSSIECWQIWELGEVRCVYMSVLSSNYGSE